MKEASSGDRDGGGGDGGGEDGLSDFVEAWNGRQGLPMPDHHRRIAGWLEECWRGGRRHLLLMAFRSSGKSTLVGLF